MEEQAYNDAWEANNQLHISRQQLVEAGEHTALNAELNDSRNRKLHVRNIMGDREIALNKATADVQSLVLLNAELRNQVQELESRSGPNVSMVQIDDLAEQLVEEHNKRIDEYLIGQEERWTVELKRIEEQHEQELSQQAELATQEYSQMMTQYEELQ